MGADKDPVPEGYSGLVFNLRKSADEFFYPQITQIYAD
jgi:hypothetical protein